MLVKGKASQGQQLRAQVPRATLYTGAHPVSATAGLPSPLSCSLSVPLCFLPCPVLSFSPSFCTLVFSSLDISISPPYASDLEAADLLVIF